MGKRVSTSMTRGGWPNTIATRSTPPCLPLFIPISFITFRNGISLGKRSMVAANQNTIGRSFECDGASSALN